MRVERSLRWAAILVIAGTIVTLLCLLRVHPVSFIAFLTIACPLLCAGVVLYLLALLKYSEGDSGFS